MDIVDQVLTFLKQGGWMVIPILGTTGVAWGVGIYKGLVLNAEAKQLTRWLAEGVPTTPKDAPRFYANHVQAWQSGLSTLQSLGSLLPMLGLLGTITGIIGVFNVLGLTSGEYHSIAKGIGEALINTQLGLLGAIPALFGYTVLCNRVDAMSHRLKQLCSDLVDPLA